MVRVALAAIRVATLSVDRLALTFNPVAKALIRKLV
jgi:hypothetical protein